MITIKLKRDTAANWTIANPILSVGEPGLETDTNNVKYGDGRHAWSELPYANSLVPAIDSSESIGSVSKAWDQIHVNNIKTRGNLDISTGADHSYWHSVYENISNSNYSYGLGGSVNYDSQGNSYVFGVEIDNFAQHSDTVALKYDPDGNLLWRKAWVDTDNLPCGTFNQTLYIDSNDVIYWSAVATYTTTTTYVGTMDTDGVISDNATRLDNFVANDTVANFINGQMYLSGFINTGTGYDIPTVVSVDPGSTATWVLSLPDLNDGFQFYGIDFDPNLGIYAASLTQTETEFRDCTIYNIDPNTGNVLNSVVIALGFDNTATGAIVYVNNGSVYINITTEKGWNYVAKLSSDLSTVIWQHQVGVEYGNLYISDINFDATNNVYITGQVDDNFYIAGLDDSTGLPLWERTFGNSEWNTDITFGGHQTASIYQNSALVITGTTNVDVNNNSTDHYHYSSIITVQLPLDGSMTGTHGNFSLETYSAGYTTATMTTEVFTTSTLITNGLGVISAFIPNTVFVNADYVPIRYEIGPGTHGWTFGTDGDLTVPGYINGQPGNSLRLQSYGDNLKLRRWDNSGTHVSSAINLNESSVYIYAENSIWHYDAVGNLTIPGAGDIQDANGSVVRVASTSTAPTRVNGQLWFNNVEGRLYIKDNGTWVDANPTVIPPPSTYLDDITVEGSTFTINGSTLTIDSTGTLLVNGGQVSGSSGGVGFEYSTVQEGSVSGPGQVDVTSITGLPGTGLSITSDRWAQLMWVPDTGVVTLNDIDNGGARYNWAYVDLLGLNIENKTSSSQSWLFDNNGSIELPRYGQADGGVARLQSHNGYPTLMAYGSGGRPGPFGLHGGPELDWMDSNNPDQDFYNNTATRHTLYLNDAGLYVGFNENGVVGNPQVSWTFTPDGVLQMPPGNETTAGWIQWSHASDDLNNTAGIGFVDHYNVYTGLGLVAPTDTNAAKGIWFGTPTDPMSPFDPETSMVFRGDTLYLPKNGYIKSHDFDESSGYLELGYTGTSITIQTAETTSTQHNWVFGTDGGLTFPDTTVQTTAWTGTVAYSNVTGTPVLTTSTLINGEYSVGLGTDGILTLSTASTILGAGADPNVYIETSTTSTTSTWTFGTDGNLTLPEGGTIKGGGTGTDVTIIASTGTNPATWTFAANGALTAPGTITAPNLIVNGGNISLRTNGSGIQGAMSFNISTNNFTNNWNFSQSGDLSLPNTNKITTTPTPSVGTIITDIGSYTGTSGSDYIWSTGAANFASLRNLGTGVPVGWTFYLTGNTSTSVTITSFITNPGGANIQFSAPLPGYAGGQTWVAYSPNYVPPTPHPVIVEVNSNDWTFGTDGNLTFPDATVQTTAYVAASVVNKTSGSWTLSTGSNTVSITVAPGNNYQMWVNGTCDNGIVEWNATVNVSNTNVPVVGSQYGWYYAAGNALVLTSMPNQIVGTAGSISTATIATTTSNVFTFGITNNSVSTQTVYWGYTTL